MPIIDLQRTTREIGRIRLGEYVKPAQGKARPTKLQTFRLTSQSRELIEKVAALYGGEVKEWTPQGGGTAAWEVVTTATRIPILLPPNPLSQWYEEWAGGGCKRRCDGQREVLSDSPCMCGPDPDERVCKPHTRLNVMLRDVEGLGVFRLETSGYYAAVELPGIAQFLTLAPQEYVAAYLILEWRRVKRDGKTREYAVPGIEIEGLTPAQLMSGIASQPALPPGDKPAIEARPRPLDARQMFEAIDQAESVNRLRELWRKYKDAGWLTEDIGAAISARVRDLSEYVEPETVADNDAFDNLSEEQETYHRLLSTVDPELAMSEIESNYRQWTQGGELQTASAEEMQAYIDHLEAKA